MRPLLICLLLLFQAAGIFAAEPVKVWVTLKDKGPALQKAFLGERGYENAPVYAPYLQQLRGAGFAVSVALKWQNRVSGWADSAALAAVRILPFVGGVEELPHKAPVTALPVPRLPLAKHSAVPLSKSSVDRFYDFREAFDSVGASALADTVAAYGLQPGEGVRIAVIDEDFYLGHSMFDSLFANNAIVDQWDFVDTAAQAAFQIKRDDSHGAWVLSLLAGNLPGVAVGLVPHAKFLLYRTEIKLAEKYAEEDYLAAALERAVDSGAQVINISLGYRYDFSDTSEHEFSYAMMDGRTRPSSIAALGAARRGVLVVVAAGNEGGARVPHDTTGPTGSAPQPTITAPADADSILTLGIMQGGGRCFYSSTGPTFDGRLKPEISSIGLGSGCGLYVVKPETDAGIEVQSGTSFAAPVAAGVAALLRQLHPDSTTSAQKIRQALMVTARSSNSANNQVGGGMMRAAQAHCALLLDSMVQTPCFVPPAPPLSVAVKGPLVWRGGNLNTLAWPTSLDLSRARMWDLQGRSFPVQGSLNDDGDVLLLSRRRLAPGTFILRIPRVPDTENP